MKRFEFDNCAELAIKIDDEFQYVIENKNPDEYICISIIAKYEQMKKILSEFITMGYEIEDIEISKPEFDNYYDEYVCSMTAIDSDREIWCQPMKVDDRYVSIKENIVYILDDCSSSVIKSCEDCEFIYEVCVRNDEDTDDKEIKNCNDYSGKNHCKDFTTKNNAVVSKSGIKESYKVNGRPVSKEKFDKVIEHIDDIYVDNMKDMLLKYAAIQDELNGWRKWLYW